MSSGPITDITFGSALTISLNNYYDLLKDQVGGLKAEEFLQLKLVADALDLSQTNYPWFSLHNLHDKSNVAIEPSPVDSTVSVSAVRLDAVYGEFLRRLVTYVIAVNLSDDDQKQYNSLALHLQGLRDEIQGTSTTTGLVELDRIAWAKYAATAGYSPTDMSAQAQWNAAYGHGAEISQIMSDMSLTKFKMNALLNKQYPDPVDAEIVQASTDYDSDSMRMCYPISPDYLYAPDNAKFSLGYLSGLPQVNSGLFDSLRVISWDKTLSFMQSQVVGAMDAKFDKTTDDSSSISSDWGASMSADYGPFISVNASASSSTQIKQDFSTATSVEVSAAAVYKVGLVFPRWFRPELFQCKRVLDNISDFQSFFGPNGTLLYYPTQLICVRGFKIVFSSSQNWTYDYDHNFSAKAGGGLHIFGINFGPSSNYTNDTKEHQVVTSGTNLTVYDDPNTIRFVGYAVAKNNLQSITAHDVFKKRIGLPVYNSMVASIK